MNDLHKNIDVLSFIPGPALRVSIKLRISFPTVPIPRPSPVHRTLLASQTPVTFTLRGQPLTCLK